MYKIGQVLFIIANGTKTIEPIQVHSKQTLESWDGTSIQHMCATVDNKTISLEKHQEKGLLAGVFENVEGAQELLLQLASEMVSKLANDAREKASVFEPQTTMPKGSQAQHEIVQATEHIENAQKQSIILEDGTKATLHLPPELT